MNDIRNTLFFTPLDVPRFGERGGRRQHLWELKQPQAAAGLSWRLFLLALVLLVLLVGGGFLYIREVTSTASSGYDVSALERRLEDVRTQETRLLLETAELQSLQRVEELLPKLNLAPASSTAYTAPILDGALTGQAIPVAARP